MYKTTRGLVLRETTYKESDKILTVLTEDDGKLTVSARGARKKSSNLSAAAQLFAFSEMTLHQHKGRFYLREARTLELFSGLRKDILPLAAASYFAELMEAVTDEDIPNPGILLLGLNSLYLLSSEKKDCGLVKAVFELRLICLAGYAPSLEGCAFCGKTPKSPMLDTFEGYIFCKLCKPDAEGCVPLSVGSVAAMRHIAQSPPDRVFSFSLGREARAGLFEAAERYVISQLGRGFKTLDFLKGISEYGFI